MVLSLVPLLQGEYDAVETNLIPKAGRDTFFRLPTPTLRHSNCQLPTSTSDTGFQGQNSQFLHFLKVKLKLKRSKNL